MYFMKIKFTGIYKSLSSFESEDLSNFCIITGRNGAGKTQLIEAIKSQYSAKTTPQIGPAYTLDIFPYPNRPQFEGIDIGSATAVSSQSWQNKIKPLAFELVSLLPEVKAFLQALVANGVEYKIINTRILDLSTVINKNNNPHQYVFDICMAWQLAGVHSLNFPGKSPDEIFQLNLHILKVKLFSFRKSLLLASLVAEYKNKPIPDLHENDFYVTPLDEIALEANNIFFLPIENLFYNYAKKRHHNEFEYFRRKEYAEINNAISDIAFTAQNPPPWSIMNEIFKTHGFNYTAQGIEKTNFSNELVYEFRLVNNSSGAKVNFPDLSSGEKLIVGLNIKLFISHKYDAQLEFLDYLFLDEPDAHLHPEMTRFLLDVLHNTFVKKFGINVVITTHDPSTIALSPEGCIYELKNHPTTVLKKIDKDEALRRLTENLPMLSIDYKNHRQVFVEGPIDVLYYQVIFNKSLVDFKFPFKLYFMSHSSGKGNCSEVIKIVKDIRHSGNKTIFGLIDWDRTNKSSANTYIVVHGENERYSIENFILDPLYLAVLFLTTSSIQITYMMIIVIFQSTGFMSSRG